MGTGVLPPRAKRPGREVDHSPPFSAKVKMSEVIPLPYLYKSLCSGQEKRYLLFIQGVPTHMLADKHALRMTIYPLSEYPDKLYRSSPT
jgi:hypothetical protein